MSRRLRVKLGDRDSATNARLKRYFTVHREQLPTVLGQVNSLATFSTVPSMPCFHGNQCDFMLATVTMTRHTVATTTGTAIHNATGAAIQNTRTQWGRHHLCLYFSNSEGMSHPCLLLAGLKTSLITCQFTAARSVNNCARKAAATAILMRRLALAQRDAAARKCRVSFSKFSACFVSTSR